MTFHMSTQMPTLFKILPEFTKKYPQFGLTPSIVLYGALESKAIKNSFSISFLNFFMHIANI